MESRVWFHANLQPFVLHVGAAGGAQACCFKSEDVELILTNLVT